MYTEIYIPKPDQRAYLGARWTLIVAMLGIIVLGVWASVARIDQVTSAQGQIIPSTRTQVIQAPDAGVIAAMHVQEGQAVKAGQLLATLEKGRAQVGVDDSGAKVAALRITLIRLQAELNSQIPSFPQELQRYPEYMRNQINLYKRRRTAIEEEIKALNGSLLLAREELKMNESLEKMGDVSRADLLRLRRQVADIETQITSRKNKYLQDAQTEMTRAQEDLNSQMEILHERTQSLDRMELFAPTDGIVKNVRMTTLGAVVRAADPILELVPTDSELVAEAKVSPADIAFIHVGQSVSIKLDAYDYAIFGAMRGEVSYISPDTLIEDTKAGPLPNYRVQIRIKQTEFSGAQARHINVRPGMTAIIDIKSAERTVLSYLIKPITKTLHESMGER